MGKGLGPAETVFVILSPALALGGLVLAVTLLLGAGAWGPGRARFERAESTAAGSGASHLLRPAGSLRRDK